MLQRECQRQDEEHIWEAVEDGQTDPWPPPPVSKMSLSKTLKLRVNCHSEQPSGSSDSVVSHHCVTVNVTTSALWRQKHSLYRFCFRRLFPGNIWKMSPAQWRISYNFFIREGKAEHSKHSIKIKTTTKNQSLAMTPIQMYVPLYSKYKVLLSIWSYYFIRVIGMHRTCTVSAGSAGFVPSMVCRVGQHWTEQGQANKSPGNGSRVRGRWMMDLSARVHNSGTGEHGGEGQQSALFP